ncbi:MAG: glycerophosphodiester phosphodiesterase family protein [Pedobacter sp.]|nr:glycerophosphodiester phosphodiesterase family protein [Pedobacter sp.]
MMLCGLSGAAQQNLGQIKNVQELQRFFSYRPGRDPLLIAHRGGTVAGLPENCLATFAHTVKMTTQFLEIDPRLTKDSVIVIMHDPTLERTTNGKGKIEDYTWKELQQLRLKDAQGKLTDHQIPSLEAVIRWARGKCILLLDRKNVPLSMMVDKLKKWKAEAQVILSAFELPDAKAYHRLNPELMLEIYIKNAEQLKMVEQSGIPWKNIIAYVSQPKTREFYDLLHSKGIMSIVYTATVVEKEKDANLRKQAYRDIIAAGGDIILADKVEEVMREVKSIKYQVSSRK